MKEYLELIIVGVTGIIGFFLKQLHGDHTEVKKRLSQLEVEQAVQRAAHSSMSDTLLEMKAYMREMYQGLEKRLERMEEKLEKK